MSKARASTEKPTPKEPVAAEGKKRKERVKKTVARVLGKASIFFLCLVAAFGKLFGVLLLPSSEELEGLVPSLM